MRRIVVMSLSAIMALVVAIPIASAQETTNLANLTAEWWNWGFSTSPSPLDGSYTGGTQCEGEYVDGVFFLAGSFDGPTTVERTCTVPANTPMLFSPFNYLCGEAPTVQQPDGTFTGDPKPYTKCAKATTDAVIDPPSSFYARVDGKDANQQRIASGIFQWTIPKDALGLEGLEAGAYPAAQDGIWVYLENGLNKGNHTVVFGGHFEDTPFGTFEGTKVTYKLKAR